MHLAFQLALLLVTQGAYLTKQVGYLFLGLGLHTGRRVQEKGWGVKYGFVAAANGLQWLASCQNVKNLKFKTQ